MPSPLWSKKQNQTVKIVVIDTGYNTENNTLKLCDQGIDLTGYGLNDNLGHGNNVAHIIADGLKDEDYCIYPIKLFNDKTTSIDNFSNAMEMTNNIPNVDIVNLSYGGSYISYRERYYLRKLLDKGIKVVAAAGNYSDNLDINCNYYPACYDDRIITVGMLGINNLIHKLSNYGNYVKKWTVGENITAGGRTLSGTSQSTAVETVKQAKELINKRHSN